MLLLTLGLRPGFWAVVWAQALFVFPYVMIALSDPWRARDPRLDRTAAALGAGRGGGSSGEAAGSAGTAETRRRHRHRRVGCAVSTHTLHGRRAHFNADDRGSDAILIFGSSGRGSLWNAASNAAFPGLYAGLPGPRDPAPQPARFARRDCRMTLIIRDLSVRLGDRQPLFPPLSLSVEGGQVGTIMGRSGIGNPRFSMRSAGIWRQSSRCPAR